VTGATLDDLLRDPGWATSKLTRPDGTRLNVATVGAGPPVLLVHGYGASIAQWTTVAPPLVAAGRRVIAYDQRAHGRSTCGGDGISGAALFGDLAAVVGAMELDDVTVVGHSMGTFTTMGAMAHADLRARSSAVVLVSPETGDVYRGAPTTRMLAPLARAGVLSIACRRDRVGTRIAAQTVGPDASPAVVEATRRMLASTPGGPGPCIGMMARESVAAVLPALDCPTTVLWGTADTTTPLWHAELIAARAPRATLVRLDRIGHMVPWEAPQAVVDAVLEGV
jgi:pimeloyl-ACP methyl ester carboxylesterase